MTKSRWRISSRLWTCHVWEFLLAACGGIGGRTRLRLEASCLTWDEAGVKCWSRVEGVEIWKEHGFARRFGLDNWLNMRGRKTLSRVPDFCLGQQHRLKRETGIRGGGADLWGRVLLACQRDLLLGSRWRHWYRFLSVESQFGGRYFINFTTSLLGRSAVCMEWSSSKRTFCSARGSIH